MKQATLSNDGGRPIANLSLLPRQNSIYSLTLDEFQNTLGSLGKDFGSMNMDEFLKNIWTYEETQAMASALGSAAEGGTLQRQGSLTLPRTLSQKKVDEVWRDLLRENGGKDVNGNSGVNYQQQQQRQQTLGEITLEEFLVRAGVVREDTQPTPLPNNAGFFGEIPHLNKNSSIGLGYSQTAHSNGIGISQLLQNNNQVPKQSPNLAMNVNAVRTMQQQKQIFPKQTNVPIENINPRSSPCLRTSIVSNNEAKVSSALAHCGGGGLQSRGVGMGVMGLGAKGVPVAMESPDGLSRSSGETSSFSPVPYVFSGSIRGRKCNGTVDKVVERRQRRMIKNRESAARSRARKQAYTMELEAEVSKLKEENKELQRKQAEIFEIQKNQVLGIINEQHGPKRRCLTRTQTWPW